MLIKLSSVGVSEFQRFKTNQCQNTFNNNVARKLAPLWPNLWKVSAENSVLNKYNLMGQMYTSHVFLNKFHPFKTFLSMNEHLFAEPYLQGFKTGKQNNNSQNSVWNSAIGLWKIVNFENLSVKIMKKEKKNTKSHLQMFETFFSSVICFQCCKNFF